MVQETSALAGLVKPDEYQAQTSHLFPSTQSIRWYVRQHRSRLVESGALLYIAGRHWINPKQFDAYILAEGTRDRQQVAA